MPDKAGPERDDEADAMGAPGADEDDQQTEKAARLANRAGESVDRRYDATKEIHHDECE